MFSRLPLPSPMSLRAGTLAYHHAAALGSSGMPVFEAQRAQRRLLCHADSARAAQMVFRTQFLLTGPGLQPWHSDAQFVAGMTRYLQVGGSGVGNLTLNNWLPFNATQTPVRQLRAASCQMSAGLQDALCCLPAINAIN